MITIKVVSLTCQDVFYDNRCLDAEVTEYITISGITKEGVDYNDVPSLSSYDISKLIYGRRISSKNKIKLEDVTDVIICYDNPSSQIKSLKTLLKLPTFVNTYKLIKSRLLDPESFEQYPLPYLILIIVSSVQYLIR